MTTIDGLWVWKTMEVIVIKKRAIKKQKFCNLLNIIYKLQNHFDDSMTKNKNKNKISPGTISGTSKKFGNTF